MLGFVLLTNRILRLALESAARQGVDRDALVARVGFDVDALVAPGGRVEWGTMVAVLDELGRTVAGNRETLSAIGRGMRSVDTPDLVRDAARGFLSARARFRFLDEWVTPQFPHMRMYMRFVTDRRVQMHGEILEPYAPCLTFFHVLEARIACLSEMVGLPPSIVVESRLTERTADIVLDLPVDRTLGERLRRMSRAVVARPASRRALEEQRQELAANIDALQRARDELRVVLDRLPDLVLVHRVERLAWANQMAVKTLGYDSLEQLVGLPLHDLAIAETADARPLLTEVVLRSRAGEEVVVEAAASQSVVFDGLPAQLTVARDVTERTRMQQKLIVADRLASVGLLAAGVAHEVNNPLAYVLNNIEIAQKVTGDDEDDVRRKALGVALEGVERIRAIIRDLLLLSRGDGEVTGPVDLRQVVESTLTLARPQIERGARLVTEYGATQAVLGSAPRIGQILLNLVANALGAMRGRTLEESVLGVRVGTTDDGRPFVQVSDTGVGIAAQHLGRVFEPFFTTKPASDGTGLGLAIAQRLAVEMGGEITVTSEVGLPTTFRVVLPSAAVPEEEGQSGRGGAAAATK